MVRRYSRRVVGPDRAFREPALRASAKPAPGETVLGLLRGREVPRAAPALEVRAEARLVGRLVGGGVDRGDVAHSAALGDEAPAAAEGAAQRREEGVVVGDPVERRGREHDVGGVSAQVELDEVRDAEVDVGAQALARGVDHRGRLVHADHPTVRDALAQQLGHAGRSHSPRRRPSRRRGARGGP